MTSSRRRSKLDPVVVGLLDELGRLYGSIDERYAGHSCPGSTECCRFGITGREPYVTSIELVAVARAIAARGGPLKQAKRALPMARDERTCPLLDASARCAIYRWRPLGCRTFYCERASSDQPVRQPEVNDMVRQLKDLANRHRPNGDKGRPLTRALDSLSRGKLDLG